MTRILFLSAALLFSIHSSAQEVWKHFTSENSGLLNNRSQAIAFDENNTLWVAYEGVGGDGLGLGKFDGTTWTSYNKTNSGLPNNDVRVITSDHQGNMWFGCYNAGMVKYNIQSNSWTLYNTFNSGLQHDNITAITIDNNGNIWVGMYFGGVSKFDGINWTHYNVSNAPFPESNCINDVVVDKDFNVWVALGCGGGFARMTPDGIWSSWTSANSDIPNHTVTAILPVGEGKVWLGYLTHYISLFDGTAFTNYTMSAPVNTSVAYHGFAMDHTGQIWCSSQGAGLLRFTGTAWENVNIPGSDNTVSFFCQSVAIDQSNNVWWGEMFNGLWKKENEIPGGMIWIADPNFRNCLKESYPQIFSAENFIIADSAKKITTIQCDGKGIRTLAGIQGFENLIMFSCGNNQLTTVNEISGLTKLKNFHLHQNNLTSLPDLSQLPELTDINVMMNNISQWPDLTHNPEILNLFFYSNKLGSIDDLSHLTRLQFLIVGNNPLTTLPPLHQNTELASLNIQGTQLSNFPDLSDNLKLYDLHFGYNSQFSTWPDITANTKLKSISCHENNLSSIPDLSIYPELRALSCPGNNLHELPDLSMFTQLDYLDAANNHLTFLPDLSQTLIGTYPSQLNVSDNQLTFEDLIPLVTLPGYGVLSYQPQTITAQSLIINKNEGDTLSLTIQVDHSLGGNTYTWFKDNELLTTTNRDNLTIPKLTANDAGTYHCEITNPSAPDLKLLWESAVLTVSDPCAMYDADDFTVQITLATCLSGGKILITENGLPASSVEEFLLEEIHSGDQITSTDPEIVELPEGEYKLSMKKDGCISDRSTTIEIAKDQNCNNPVISPNNDGQSEDYYIPFQGTAKIYNRQGQIVNEFIVPSSWNGTDRSGNFVPMGLYVIVCDGQKEITITVVR
jgi:internalin A